MPNLYENIDTEHLEDLMKDKDTRFAAFIEYASQVTKEVGKDTHHQVHECHESRISEVDKFHDFKLQYDGYHSMMGGETVEIYFQGELVFEATKYSEVKVATYVPNEWENKLTNLIENAEESIKTHLASNPNLQESIKETENARTKEWRSSEKFYAARLITHFKQASSQKKYLI